MKSSFWTKISKEPRVIIFFLFWFPVFQLHCKKIYLIELNIVIHEKSYGKSFCGYKIGFERISGNFIFWIRPDIQYPAEYFTRYLAAGQIFSHISDFRIAINFSI